MTIIKGASFSEIAENRQVHSGKTRFYSARELIFRKTIFPYTSTSTVDLSSMYFVLPSIVIRSDWIVIVDDSSESSDEILPFLIVTICESSFFHFAVLGSQ